MPYTYLFAVTFDDAEVADLYDPTLPSPRRAQDLVKRGLDFAQEGTVDAIVETYGELADLDTDNYGQCIVYTGFKADGTEFDPSTGED